MAKKAGNDMRDRASRETAISCGRLSVESVLIAKDVGLEFEMLS